MKRPNVDSVDSSSIAASEIASVSDQISGLCKTFSSLSDNLSTSITSAINNLTCVLGQKLDKITEILEAQTTNANATERMQVDNYTRECNFEHQASTENIKEELKNLKNLRYQSLQRIAYNSNHAELYRLSVLAEPKLVPKKKHEHIAPHDPEGLREVKIKKTLFNVDCEIEELLYHKNIQEEKVKRIDVKAKSTLEGISSSTVRHKMQEDWEIITKKGEESIAKMWEKKREFLQSSAHMIKLGTVTPSKDKSSLKRSETLSYKQALLRNSNEQSFDGKHKTDGNRMIRRQQENTINNATTSVSQAATNYRNHTIDNRRAGVDIDSNDWTMVSRSKNGKGWQTSTRMK